MKKSPPSSRVTRRSFLLATGALVCPQLCPAGIDQQLSAQLQQVYASWKTSMDQGNLKEWGRLTSRYRQMSVRNLVVSRGLQWPRALFNMMLMPPDASKAKIIHASAVADTARIAFYGRIDFQIPGQAVPENLLLVEFLKETGGWKYDTLRYLNITDEAVRTKLAAGNDAFLLEEDFALSGIYPEVPKPCPEPYMVAEIHCQAVGYKATINVNGLHNDLLNPPGGIRTIIGGLKRGANPTSILPLKDGEMEDKNRSLEVRILIPSGRPGKAPYEAAKWKYDPTRDGEKVSVVIVGPSR